MPGASSLAGALAGFYGAQLADFVAAVDTLPRDREVITYCRGPHCTYAYEAVGMLRADGLRARRLDGGFLAWRACEIERRQRAAACP